MTDDAETRFYTAEDVADKTKRELIEMSVREWEKRLLAVRAAKTARDVSRIPIGAANCPLCARYASGYELYCAGCPVAKKSGKSDCSGTPYSGFVRARSNLEHDWTSEKFEFLRRKLQIATEKEVEFLRSLLDEPGVDEPEVPDVRIPPHVEGHEVSTMSSPVVTAENTDDRWRMEIRSGKIRLTFRGQHLGTYDSNEEARAALEWLEENAR